MVTPWLVPLARATLWPAVVLVLLWPSRHALPDWVASVIKAQAQENDAGIVSRIEPLVVADLRMLRMMELEKEKKQNARPRK